MHLLNQVFPSQPDIFFNAKSSVSHRNSNSHRKTCITHRNVLWRIGKKTKMFISPDWGVLSKFYKLVWTPEISSNQPLNFSFSSKSHFKCLNLPLLFEEKLKFLQVGTCGQFYWYKSEKKKKLVKINPNKVPKFCTFILVQFPRVVQGKQEGLSNLLEVKGEICSGH